MLQHTGGSGAYDGPRILYAALLALFASFCGGRGDANTPSAPATAGVAGTSAEEPGAGGSGVVADVSDSGVGIPAGAGGVGTAGAGTAIAGGGPAFTSVPALFVRTLAVGAQGYVATGSSGFGKDYGGGLIVDSKDMTEAIFMSDDGRDWTQVFSGSVGEISHVAYGNGRYAAVGFNEATVIYTSDDVRVWDEHPVPVEIPGALAFGNGRFMLVDRGSREPVLYTSEDGATWDTVAAPKANLHFLGFAAGRFLAAGGSDLFTSEDGIDWTLVEYAGLPVSRLFAFDNLFVLVTSTPGPGPRQLGFATSPDGLTWDVQGAPQDPVTIPVWSSEVSCVGLRLDPADYFLGQLAAGSDCGSPLNVVGYFGTALLGPDVFLLATGKSVLTSDDGLAWETTLSAELQAVP